MQPHDELPLFKWADEAPSVFRRCQPFPCIKIYAADMVTVTETRDCVDWCPLLNRRLHTDEKQGDRAWYRKN